MSPASAIVTVVAAIGGARASFPARRAGGFPARCSAGFSPLLFFVGVLARKGEEEVDDYRASRFKSIGRRHAAPCRTVLWVFFSGGGGSVGVRGGVSDSVRSGEVVVESNGFLCGG